VLRRCGGILDGGLVWWLFVVKYGQLSTLRSADLPKFAALGVKY
jgi:hypothetical protein